MSEAQADLDEARRAFQESNARRDAAAHRAKWSEGQQGVKCAPSRDAGGRFLHNCSMTASDHLPIIVSATVVEIKEPSKFVAFLGDTLEKAKPSIQSAVDASLPVARATADEKERAAKEDFELAKADVAIAEQELASAKSEEKLSKAKELLAKKIEANRKARAAGLPEPYPLP